MARGGRFSKLERERIEARFKAGAGIEEVAAEFDRNFWAVWRIAMAVKNRNDPNWPHKDCDCCGESFPRPIQTTHKRWSSQRFCSQACNQYFQHHGRRDNSVDRVSREEWASRELLRRLVRYGMRHDGLPGLPANDLIHLATELGVAA